MKGLFGYKAYIFQKDWLSNVHVLLSKTKSIQTCQASSSLFIACIFLTILKCHLMRSTLPRYLFMCMSLTISFSVNIFNLKAVRDLAISVFLKLSNFQCRYWH